jgi:hypothetical protein
MTVQKDHIGSFMIKVRLQKGASYKDLRSAVRSALTSTPKMKFVEIKAMVHPDPYGFSDPDNPPSVK